MASAAAPVAGALPAAAGAGSGSAAAAAGPSSSASAALAAAQLERGKAFVQVLSCVLSRLVAANDAVADPGPITKFHALRPPSISIGDYCSRIYKYASCSPECFVLALVFIDRLIQRNSLLLTSLNVHRIIITAVMLAAKFFDDAYFNNAYYAKVGGVPTSEVNALELEFLFSINFSLHVPTDVYEKYYGELGNHMGVGVPPELLAHNTCNCARFAPAIAYAGEELRHTGMRPLDAMAAESLAAFAASGGAAGSDAASAGASAAGGGGMGGGMATDESAAAAAGSAAAGGGGAAGFAGSGFAASGGAAGGGSARAGGLAGGSSGGGRGGMDVDGADG